MLESECIARPSRTGWDGGGGRGRGWTSPAPTANTSLAPDHILDAVGPCAEYFSSVVSPTPTLAQHPLDLSAQELELPSEEMCEEAVVVSKALTTDMAPAFSVMISGVNIVLYYIVACGDVDQVHEFIQERVSNYPNIAAVDQAIHAYTCAPALPELPRLAVQERTSKKCLELSSLTFGYYVSSKPSIRQVANALMKRTGHKEVKLTLGAVWQSAINIRLVPKTGLVVYQPVGKPVVPNAQAYLGSG